MPAPLRVVLDGTPLLGQRTGVGRYVEHLMRGLAELARDEATARTGRTGRDGAEPGTGVRAGTEIGVRAGTGAAGSAAGRPLDLAATAFTFRGLESLPGAVPPGVRTAGRRAPARLLHEAWARGERLPVELLTGPADIVHGTNFVLPPLRAARGVLTVHDLSYLRTPDTVSSASARYTTLVPRGLRRAAAVITPSQAVAEEVIAAYRLDRELVTATPLGVDDAWFDVEPPDAAWLRAHELPERYLVFVGSAEPRKNLPVLLAALRGLHGTYPDIPPLVLVGPAGWGPTLDVAGLPAGAVVNAGYLDVGELRRMVAGAVALCFPSRYEGFGLPPLEALAAGTPVVAADIPAVREVTTGVIGTAVRLVAPADVDGLSDALLDVIDGGFDGLGDGSPALAPEASRALGAGGPGGTELSGTELSGGELGSGELGIGGARLAGRAHARAFTWRRTAELTAAVYRRAAAS